MAAKNQSKQERTEKKKANQANEWDLELPGDWVPDLDFDLGLPENWTADFTEPYKRKSNKEQTERKTR